MSDTNAKGITSGRQDGGPRNCGPRMIAVVGPYGSGKTSLLESLLHATGATTRKGAVSAGNTVGDASAEARALLAATLRDAGERHVFLPLALGLAGAALLLEDGGDSARAAEVAGLAAGLPLIGNNRGLRACLLPRGTSEPKLFGSETSAEARGGDPDPALWAMARQLGARLAGGE